MTRSENEKTIVFGRLQRVVWALTFVRQVITSHFAMPAAPTSSYRIAEQIGGWAVFADITLSAIARTDGSPMVALDDNVAVDADGRYLAGIAFGAAYALGYVPDSRGVGIFVHKLHTNPVDTTPMALAFVTCHAVFNCFDVSPRTGPFFDRSTKSFVFPC